MKANVIVFEAAILVFTIIFYQGANRIMGKRRNRSFFIGAICFSLAIETISVAGGIKNFYWYAQNDYYTHYPLGGYIIWFGLVPLAYCLLWYLVVMTSYITATTLVPKAKSYWSSSLAGVIAFVFFLMVEPIAVTNHWWTWNLKSFYILDMPVVGWISIFLATFIFTWTYHSTIFEKLDLGIFSRLENITIKRWPIKSRKLVKNLDWEHLQMVLLFRLGFGLIAFSAVMAPFMVIFWAVANRGQIPPTW